MEAVVEKKEITDLDGKFLTFVLGDEIYGIEILKAREIIGLMDITTVPQTPDYMKGVINLRGKVIPVIDLRMKFLIGSDILNRNPQNPDNMDVFDNMSDCESIEEGEISDSELQVIESRI